MQKPSFTKGIADGQYPAVIFQYIELGNQPFSNATRQWYSPQVLIGFDIPSENQMKSSTFFLSLNPSRNGQLGYREVADAIAGHELTDEELEAYTPDMIGTKVLITIESVESKGVIYSNITKVEKYTGDVESSRTPLLFEIDTFGDMDFDALPEFAKVRVQKSKEYQSRIVRVAKKILTNPTPNVSEDIDLRLDLDSKEEIDIKDIPF